MSSMNDKFLAAIRFGLIATIIGFGGWRYAELRPYLYVSYETGINQPDAAYDAILRGTLRTYGESPQLKASAHPTEALRQAIKQLPHKDGILFLGSLKNPGHLALRLIANTLSWPQPLYNPGCGDAYPGDPPPDNFQASGAIYYHASPPATMATKQTFLPEMIVTQAPEKTAWNSFCPQ